MAEKTITPFMIFWQKFKKQKSAMVAGIFIFFLILAAIFAPFIAPYDPYAIDYGNAMMPPSPQHWAGTDIYGRDILSRIIYGARISLTVGISSVTIGAIVGVSLGLISGFFGGFLDEIIMRSADVLFAFPGILLAIAVVAILGPGLVNVVAAVAIFSIPTFARIVRSNTLSLKESLYVRAARSMGASNKRIMFVHIMPGTLSGAIVYFTMRIGTSILTASSLSFLGLGAQPPTPEWGAMLAESRDYIGVADHLTIFPGIAIFLTVLAFNIFGDGLRAAFDPKLR
ncbi:MAG: ABC transporter permease subunit [Spirochaetia bacterium]|jgi:glutathione transport system permease protein|uniref:Glutathione transport system permease protein GsiD n=1 Tax=uncultured spirochete TaxID=156406 RepID=A0A3P3XJ69_9SPIR|nr:ABC transporter permease subunit [Rectinema subterraneum]MDQ7795940.1 ABC transporter permease subunit [Spirochaetia bacterium]SLM12801.1 putative peptide transporter permease subunit: membrane component of ABC superfamily [uncultured spirochete]